MVVLPSLWRRESFTKFSLTLEQMRKEWSESSMKAERIISILELISQTLRCRSKSSAHWKRRNSRRS